jgi:aminodeoxychorismate lyase
MPTVVRLNGQTLDFPHAAVRAFDHGFLYGNGLFETLRATNGRPFALEDHLQRLRRSGDVIGLPVPASEALGTEVLAALRDSAEVDAYVRLTVSRGSGAPGPDPSSCEAPTVMVVVRPLPAPPARWLTEGLRAITSPVRRNTSSPLTRVKSLNYMECILAKQAAKAAGADEAIFLDTEGNLAEATAWNLFFVEGERLLTPSDAGPILPGITRAIVLRLAQEAGIECEAGAYAPSRLGSAREAFLTNSLYGVMPLAALDSHRIGEAVPGAITSRLCSAYESLTVSPS